MSKRTAPGDDPQKRKLWYLFLHPYPRKFYKQRIIDSYIVDFYCAAAKLVIEVDGSQRYTEAWRERDEGRSAMLEQYGLPVLRFSNREINTEFEAVCQMIHQTVQERQKGYAARQEGPPPALLSSLYNTVWSDIADKIIPFGNISVGDANVFPTN